MELSLKKARKLEAAIQAHLDENNAIEITAKIRSLGSLDEAKETIAKSKEEALKNLAERETLIRLRYDIRRQIEIKNEESGINDLINQKVITGKLIDDLRKLENAEALSEVELADTLKVHSATVGTTEDSGYSSYSRPKNSTPKVSFNTNILSKEDVEGIAIKKSEYRKQMETLEDTLSYKNLSNNIVLSQDSQKLLQSLRLL